MRILTYCFVLGVTLLISSCKKDSLFVIRKANDTGITFNNRIEEYTSDSLNALLFEYIYDGAGVAVGDVNNDGLLDIYFAGNLVSGQLYLNQGDLQFKDITEISGISSSRWGTGAAMVDINQDGLLDIYLCVAGPPNTLQEDLRNQLFINQELNENGVPVFKDRAKEFGLDDDGYSTMVAFLDYDKDNHLDMYLVSNSLEQENRNILKEKITDGTARNNDILFRNNGDNTFTNVNQAAGVLTEGWGLGICVSDLNQDGWQDIYVANDFVSNDFIWINQKDGTFVNEAATYLKHQTHNGMGVDIADYNNDLLPDIMVLDMLPVTNYREKLMISSGSYDLLIQSREMGYEDQYMRNTLQLNRGVDSLGKIRFSEIAYLAGVAKTDWSWGPSLADFDNDGYKDLFIANGYRKDMTNLDFLVFTGNARSQMMFGTNQEQKANQLRKEGLDQLSDVKLANYIFKNNGDLTFSDMSSDWGINVPTFSNGAAYGDLDNDGDLDLVVNNMDDVAMILENTMNPLEDPEMNHYIRIKLVEAKEGPLLYGTKVCVSINGKQQFLEYNPYRGFKSTVDPTLHFGVGQATSIDSIEIYWTDDSYSLFTNVNPNQSLTITYDKNGQSNSDPVSHPSSPRKLLGYESAYFEKYNLRHHEDVYIDFHNTPLLPHLLSNLGPNVAVGDLNGDQLDDFVLGDDSGFPSRIVFQQKEGTFKIIKLPGDSIYEDRDILLFDIENDGDLDIYIASGGSKWWENDESYQDRIYSNDGKGNFSLQLSHLPQMYFSSQSVCGSDIDNDGDIDLFVGGYVVPRAYPKSPGSKLLINENGILTDRTKDLAPELMKLGIVRDAIWADINSDELEDLVVVGEWMPINAFINDNGHLQNATKSIGLEQTSGWYCSITAEDLNRDGRVDLVAGNTGKNCYYQPSKDKPVEIYAKDFDLNGTIDPILTHYNGEEKYISYFRKRFIDQISGAKSRFPTYDDFARMTFNESFTENELEGALHLTCQITETLMLNNKGDHFEQVNLPLEVQFSPINRVMINDLNGDDLPDLILVGNSYGHEPIRGDYDAGYGLVLVNKGDFVFNALTPLNSGFIVDGEAKDIAKITLDQRTMFIISRNNEPPLLYSVVK